MASQFQPRLLSPIIAEDGFPTSYQPSIPEPSPPFPPHRSLDELLPPLRYWSIGWHYPFPSSSQTSGKTHEFSHDCLCFSCEEKRDEIPATLTTRRQADFSGTHNFSVNCPCWSCEDRREDILGSPTTRQQPNPSLDLVQASPVFIPADSPQLPSAASPTGSPSVASACLGIASSEVGFSIHLGAASGNSFVPYFSNVSVRKNPSRAAKEKALARILKCSGKKSKFLPSNLSEFY